MLPEINEYYWDIIRMINIILLSNIYMYVCGNLNNNINNT